MIDPLAHRPGIADAEVALATRGESGQEEAGESLRHARDAATPATAIQHEEWRRDRTGSPNGSLSPLPIEARMTMSAVFLLLRAGGSAVPGGRQLRRGRAFAAEQLADLAGEPEVVVRR
jgi:hypothetical protein